MGTDRSDDDRAAFLASERARIAALRRRDPAYVERQREATRRWKERKRAEDPEAFNARMAEYNRRARAKKRAAREASS